MLAIKVLIVDNEPEFTSILTDRLSSWGFAATAVNSSDEVLEALSLFAPEVVVLGLDGKDSHALGPLHVIKAFDPAIEVILLAAKGMAIVGMEGLARGAFDCLPQPIELGVLIDKIRAAAGVGSKR